MKKIYLCIIGILFVVVSCQKDIFNDVQNSNEPDIDKTSDAYKFIKSRNFPDSLITVAVDYYIVDGDILVTKNLVYSGGLKHTRHVGLVSYIHQSNIKVKIDSSIPVGSDWRTAISQAVSSWNNISNCRVYFNIVTSGTPDILIKSDNGILQDELIGGLEMPEEKFQPVAAAASLPIYGQAGNELLVNLDVIFNHEEPLGPSIAQMKFIITHNLGHCVGLGHTDRPDSWYSDYLSSWERGRYVIPGSPDSGTDPDPNSIMNYGTAYKSITFSTYDLAAIQYLYGDGIRICLKTYDGQHYIYPANGGGGAVTADSDYPWEWQTLHLMESPTYGTPYYVLQTAKGQFLSAVNGGGGNIVATSTTAGLYETFELVDSPYYPGKINLKTKSTGSYLQAIDGGGGALNANSNPNEPWAWQSFEIWYSEF